MTTALVFHKEFKAQSTHRDVVRGRGWSRRESLEENGGGGLPLIPLIVTNLGMHAE
jgi:hypothetical protein